MDENPRFSLVFSKLREVCEEDAAANFEREEVVISGASEVTREELDEIENLRRMVLEVAEPEPILFTTT